MQDDRAYLRYLDAQPKLMLRPALLVLAPFLASVPLYVPNARIVRDLGGGTTATDCLVFAFAATCLALSLALAMFAAKRHAWSGFGVPLTGAAAVGYAVLVALMWGAVAFGGADGMLFTVIGVGLGACSIPVIMAWVARYASDARSVMLHGALSCMLATALVGAMSLLPAAGAAALGVACAIAGAFAPFAIACRKPQEPAADAPTSATGFGAAVRNLLSVVWLPLIGLLVCLFVSSSSEFSMGGVPLRSELVGGVLASALVVALCLVRHRTSFVLLVDKLVVPGLVAVSVVLGSFPAGTSLFALGAVYFFVPMMFLSLFAIASLVTIAAAGEFSLPFVFGSAFFLCNLVTLGGLTLGGGLALSDAMGPFLWVIICCYFAVVIVNLGYSSWRQLCRPSDDEGDDDAVPKVDPAALEAYRRQRIERLADERGLTNRERELLDYLSRGYGSSFIAKSLFISDNTARTHIRNIYRKLGVTSREELLSLFNEGQAGAERSA